MSNYSGVGSLSTAGGDAIAVAYQIELELINNGNSIANVVGRVEPEDETESINSFVGRELDLYLEGGRSIAGVQIQENGQLSYVDGQIIGFNDI